MLVLPFPHGSHANPKRGPKFFLFGKFTPFGAPRSPGKTIPSGAFENTVDCNPGITEKLRPCVSYFGLLYSYRSPKVSVRFFLTRHSSCKNPYTALLRIFDAAFAF